MKFYILLFSQLFAIYLFSQQNFNFTINDIPYQVFIIDKINKDRFGKFINNTDLNYKNQLIKPILLTSANFYSNIEESPPKYLGFTSFNGDIKNKVIIQNRMIGILLFNNKGEINIFNIQNVITTFKTYNLKKTYDQIDFFNYVSKNKISAFQTFLIAENNHLYVNQNTQKKKRDRKFLLELKGSNSETSHAIVDVNDWTTIYNSSKEILKYFRSKNYLISKMVLLDRGSNNLTVLYDNNQKILTGYSNEDDIKLAKSFMLYF